MDYKEELTKHSKSMTKRQLNMGILAPLENAAVDKVVVNIINGMGFHISQRAAVMQALFIMCSDDPTEARNRLFSAGREGWQEVAHELVYGNQTDDTDW